MLPIINGPDKDGIVIEIFHRINADGLKEKVTRKYTSSDPEGLVFRLQRKHKAIKPFGKNSQSKGFKTDATTVSADDIFIEAPNGCQPDIVQTLKNNLMKRAMRPRAQTKSILETKILKTKNKYQHPNRNKTTLDDMSDMFEEPTTQLRVTNLTPEADDSDLHELFGCYGRISRVFIAKDHVTKQSRGFAFITFHTREQAELALNELDGHGYGHLILKVEWAKARKPKTHYSGYGKPLPQSIKKAFTM
jgi:hypothetical protein